MVNPISTGVGRPPTSDGKVGLRQLVSGGAAVGLAVFLGGGVLVSYLHAHALKDAKREQGNIALMLARYTESNFHNVELLQTDVAEMLPRANVQTVEQFDERLATSAIHENLRARIAGLPQVEAIFLSDAEGRSIVSSRLWPLRDISIAYREYFQAIRDNPDLTRFLGRPIVNAVSGSWNINLAHRINAADGRFLGVVVVALNLAKFEQFLASITLDKGSSIALWRDDGILLARYPHIEEAIGRSQTQPRPFQKVLMSADSGATQSAATLNGVDRIILVQAVADYPIAVTVSRNTEEVFAVWRRQAVATFGAILLLDGAILMAVRLGIRRLRDQHALGQAYAARARAEAELTLAQERHHAEARIVHMAHHDALTGLPNRVLFRDRLADALAQTQRGEPCALLCLDLDRFKEVNDTYGHPAGDELLVAVAKRLRTEARESGTVARLGGDEFAIVLTSIANSRDASALAERLLCSLGASFDLGGNPVTIGVSIGIAIPPGDGTDLDELLRNGDLALYGAKRDGRNCYRFFEPEMNLHMQIRRTLALDLHRALAEGNFELFYQPIVNTQTRRVSGFEALLRWHHPNHGLIMPDHFIPAAEESGLIVPVGEWILQRACAEASRWPAGLKVAVNLSAIQFVNGALLPAVTAALDASGLDPGQLELEITERVMLQNTEATLASLHALKKLGIQIAMDDFGTGYSSLRYLQHFPFDRVKIDKSFIDRLDGTDRGSAIVRAITGLCAALDMSTTAEGVETEGQLDLLAANGCTEAQGYLFSHPCPGLELPAVMERLRQAELNQERRPGRYSGADRFPESPVYPQTGLGSRP